MVPAVVNDIFCGCSHFLKEKPCNVLRFLLLQTLPDLPFTGHCITGGGFEIRTDLQNKLGRDR